MTLPTTKPAQSTPCSTNPAPIEDSGANTSMPENAPPASALEMLRLSPAGMILSASEWLAGSREQYSQGKVKYDSENPGFLAAGWAVLAAPDIFVGAVGNLSWEDSGLRKFWSAFFEARRAGSPPAPLSLILGALKKDELSKGAKEMMILACRAKDSDSFGEILDIATVRRSKLVMFSAFEQGGKNVALKVKKPTKKEAQELLAICSSKYRWSTRVDKISDLESFKWLMDIAGPDTVSARVVARLAANAPTLKKDILAMAAKDYAKTMLYELRLFTPKGFARELTPNEKLEAQHGAAVLSFASTGCPEEAKSLALGVSGVALWKNLCQYGVRGEMHLAISAIGPKAETAEAITGQFRQTQSGNYTYKSFDDGPSMTLQAAACLSRDTDACRWVRAEYEALGVPWLSTHQLSKIYAGLSLNYHETPTLGELIASAISMSEAIDLGSFMDPATKQKARPKVKSL